MVAAAGITLSTSVILGTAAYVSPEQVSDGNAGPRSDVYSAGILTYELLTGRTPFTGDTALSVAYQRLDHDVPRPSAVIDGVPAQFDALVARATARDPAARFADAIEMAAELDAIAEAAREAGAHVTALVTGPVQLQTPAGITRINVESARDMYAAVHRQSRGCRHIHCRRGSG